MLCRKKRSPACRRLRRTIAVILIAAVLLTVYFEVAIKSQLCDVIIREMQTVSETAVTRAVDDFLTSNADVGERLASIRYGESGIVSAITTDPVYINYVKSSITESSQRYIDAISHDEGISAHLGSFTGLVFLANIGPMCRFDVDSTQTVSCSFESSFEQAGINQTIHHITMTVNTDILVYNPFRIPQTIHTATSYEISQTVIVGSIPSGYGGYLIY